MMTRRKSRRDEILVAENKERIFQSPVGTKRIIFDHGKYLTQIHIQAIFAVRRQVNLIQAQWEDDLYKYITGIVQANKHKLLAINGMPDHVHLCFGMRPDQSLSDLMQDIKGGSSK